MPAVGDYTREITDRLIALHAAEVSFTNAVKLKERITRTKVVGTAGDNWPQHQSGTRGKDERLEWDLMPLRFQRGPHPVPETFGDCVRLFSRTIIFRSMVTGADGLQNPVTGLDTVTEAILVRAGKKLAQVSPLAVLAPLAYVTHWGPITGNYTEEKVGDAQRIVFRLVAEIPVHVLLSSNDILGT